MSEPFIGIDLGGTQIKACVVTKTGDVLDRRETETHDTGNAAWIAEVDSLIRSLEHDNGPAQGIGLSAPGIPAADGRSIVVMPGRLEGLEGLDWTSETGRSTVVSVLNDAQAFTLGEAWLGPARACRNVVVLTLGTGVGGGVICDGQLLHGHRRRAGHLGHISLDPHGTPDCTGTPGSLEDAIGEMTLPQRSGGRFTTTVELLRAVEEQDADADRIWSRSIDCLAAAITSFINLFDPEMVVLGGGIARAGSALLEPLQARLDEIEWRPGGQPVPVVIAGLGRWAGAIGTARYAMRARREVPVSRSTKSR